MKHLNIIVEGSTEETFVNDVLVKHFSDFEIFVSTRKITTGWDRINNKPAKGGLLRYIKFRNDVLRWIQSDGNRSECWYTCMLDLYAFPKDDMSPYTAKIQSITDPYQKVMALEQAKFEALLFVEPDRLATMYPDKVSAITKLKKDIGSLKPEEINESPEMAPSKRIIKYIPDYEGQKAQVGPLVAEDIGLTKLRDHCPHFNEWITKLEKI